jgi:hypothetical protein
LNEAIFLLQICAIPAAIFIKASPEMYIQLDEGLHNPQQNIDENFRFGDSSK